MLLVTVDALRADMPWNGYARAIAPRLTALAKQSVVYTHAYALSSYTSMSLGGLMAARYPSELARDGHATSSFYADKIAFMGELLHAAGVQTIGVMGHVFFAGNTGISAGFDDWRLIPHIQETVMRDGAVTDDKLADIMIQALDDRAAKHAGDRFFAWVHFMDPHYAYARHAGYPRFSGVPDGAPPPPGVKLSKIGQNRRNRYDGEVVFTDAQIGRLLDHVAKAPWGKHTAIIVSADHGEAFGEQKSYFEHGYYLYEVTTRVPLMFHIPGVPPARIDTRRSQIDLAKTILAILGVKPDPAMRGTSLVPELLGARPPERDIVIDMPYSDQAPRRRALIHGADKIIETDNGTKPLLFDLAADPGEQHNLTADSPALLADMAKRLAAVDKAAPDYPAPRRSHRY